MFLIMIIIIIKILIVIVIILPDLVATRLLPYCSHVWNVLTNKLILLASRPVHESLQADCSGMQLIDLINHGLEQHARKLSSIYSICTILLWTAAPRICPRP
jgi:hypothetical protein